MEIKTRVDILPIAIVAAEALHLVISESLFSRVESQKMAFQDDYETIHQRAVAVMEDALMGLRGRKHK